LVEHPFFVSPVVDRKTFVTNEVTAVSTYLN
jgi:hypothetical protein